MNQPPDWSLIRRIGRAAADPKWAGGISRQQLAEIVGLEPHSKALGDAIAIAARLGRIEFCAGFITPGRCSASPAASDPWAAEPPDAGFSDSPPF